MELRGNIRLHRVHTLSNLSGGEGPAWGWQWYQLLNLLNAQDLCTCLAPSGWMEEPCEHGRGDTAATPGLSVLSCSWFIQRCVLMTYKKNSTHLNTIQSPEKNSDSLPGRHKTDKTTAFSQVPRWTLTRALLL